MKTQNGFSPLTPQSIPTTPNITILYNEKYPYIFPQAQWYLQTINHYKDIIFTKFCQYKKRPSNQDIIG